MKKYSVFDNDTGEIYDGDFKIINLEKKKKFFMSKDEALSEISEEKSKSLYSYLRRIGEINAFSQMRISGVWVSNKLIELAKEHGFEKEILNLMALTCAKHNKVKNKIDGRKTAKNWTELYSFLSISSRKRTRFKKFLIDNNIATLRHYKAEGQYEKKDIFVNPIYFRKYSHAGIQAIVAFKNHTLPNINEYSMFWLYQIGEIDMDDVNKRYENK